MESKIVGIIIEVDGTISKVGMYNLINDSEILWDGKYLNGPKIGSYLTIRQNDIKIIATVTSEKIIDMINKPNNETFDNRFMKDSINRQVELKTKGVIVNKQFEVTTKYVPMIGNEVSVTTKDELDVIYKVDGNKSTITIGKSILEGYQVQLPIDDLFASHIGIFGNTGSGKSNTLHKLYFELFNNIDIHKIKNKSQFYVIDFNGEYVGDKTFGLENSYKSVFNINTRNPDYNNKLPLLDSSFFDINVLSILFDAKPATQVPFLNRSIKKFEEIEKDNTLGYVEIGLLKYLIQNYNNYNSNLIDEWIEVTDEVICENDLLSNLRNRQIDLYFQNVRIFDGTRYLTENGLITEEVDEYFHLTEISDIINKKQSELSKIQCLKYFLKYQRIYELSYKNINPEHFGGLIKRIENRLDELDKVVELKDDTETDYNVMNIISLFNANKEVSRIIPLLFSKMIYSEHKKTSREDEIIFTKHLIIDEAHNILNGASKRDGDDWQDYRLSVFEEIIKEGRKFGFYLTLASQRPADISPTIISQLHNYIVHRLINDKDLSMLQNTMPTLDRNAFAMIPSLGKGEAVITGTAFNVPIYVKIDKEEKIHPNSNDAELTSKLWI